MKKSRFDLELGDVARVIDAWGRLAAESRTPTPEGLAPVITAFPRLEGRALLATYRRRSTDFDEESPNACIVGPTVGDGTPHFVPVVRLCVGRHDDALRLSVRVAAFHEVNSEIWAFGWRVELPDAPGEHHTTRWNSKAHVQRITGWHKTGPAGFSHLGANAPFVASDLVRPAINELKPAFPILASSPAGLLLATMYALFGPAITEKAVEGLQLVEGRADLAAFGK